jgi:hypothetical protein
MGIRLARSEDGASLVEIIMALGILATVLIALGGLMFQVAHHTRRSAMSGYRSAALSGAAAWAQALPWEAVDTMQDRCGSDSSGPMSYSQCVFINKPSSRERGITVVITPTGSFAARPDTVQVVRTKPRPVSYLRVN